MKGEPMNNHRTSQNTGWNFDNSYVRLPKIFFSSQEPTPVQSPELVMLNGTLAKELGLDLKALQAGVKFLPETNYLKGLIQLPKPMQGINLHISRCWVMVVPSFLESK